MKNNTTSALSGAEYIAIFEKQRLNKVAQINNLGKRAGSAYDEMAFIGKEYYSKQSTLREKKQEQNQLYKAKEILMQDSESINAESHENRLLRAAYLMLPIIDTIFAWNALRVIMTAKFASYGDNVALVAGTLFAVVAGYLISLLSRYAMASIERKWWTPVLIICCIIILPILYIVSEIAFNGGTEWFYSGCFAFISLIIQTIIVLGYRKMMRSKNLQTCGTADIKRKIKKTEKVLKKDIKRLQDEADKLKVDFKKATDTFRTAFRDTVAAYESYTTEYEHRPICPIGISATWLGNHLVFQREALPICNNNIESYLTKDLGYIIHMYNNNPDASLNEFLNMRNQLQSEITPLLLTADNAA